MKEWRLLLPCGIIIAGAVLLRSPWYLLVLLIPAMAFAIIKNTQYLAAPGDALDAARP